MAKNVVVTTTNNSTTQHLRKVNVLTSAVAGTSLPVWASTTAQGNTFETVVSVTPTLVGAKTVVIPSSGPVLAACRYWRLGVNFTTQDAAIIAELELRIVAAGADQTGSGTVSASGTNGANVAANAFNNSGADWWWSDAVLNTGVTTYLNYDFGVGITKDIVQIAITAHNGNASYSPRSFHVQQSSDNATWTTVWGERTNTAWTPAETRVFTRPADGLPMYGNPLSLGNRTATVAFATTVVDGLGSVANILNGVNTGQTIWWGAGQTLRTMTFDFGASASKVIDGFTWYQDISQTQGSWVFEGSNDNSAYTTFPETITLGVPAMQIQSVTNTTGYRYYRLRQTSGSTSNTNYIQEIEFKIKDA